MLVCWLWDELYKARPGMEFQCSSKFPVLAQRTEVSLFPIRTDMFVFLTVKWSKLIMNIMHWKLLAKVKVCRLFTNMESIKPVYIALEHDHWWPMFSIARINKDYKVQRVESFHSFKETRSHISYTYSTWGEHCHTYQSNILIYIQLKLDTPICTSNTRLCLGHPISENPWGVVCACLGVYS